MFDESESMNSSIVNQNKNNNLIYEMGVTYKDNKIYLEIDHRTIVYVQEIESLDTDSLDDYYNNELNNVNTLHSNGKSIPNLEVILKTHDTLASKIGGEEFNMDDFSGSISKISVP
ncbi:hypothetical protein H8356DRAFT_1672841, partial [Neocallimastix lanati (nom. inval.)]